MNTLPEVSALPDLLTVEEAAAVLRIGRTKAYAMSREWRATNGQRGLPVVDFGSVLRVPRAALEAMVGAVLVGPLPGSPAAAVIAVAVEGTPESPATPTQAKATPSSRRRQANSTDQRVTSTDQLDLFNRTAS